MSIIESSSSDSSEIQELLKDIGLEHVPRDAPHIQIDIPREVIYISSESDTDSSVEIPSITEDEDDISDENDIPPSPNRRYDYSDLPDGVDLPRRSFN